jgi:hypothetical protein
MKLLRVPKNVCQELVLRGFWELQKMAGKSYCLVPTREGGGTSKNERKYFSFVRH